MLTDTIAAISTGGNNSGINIIRISGEYSKKIIDKIFTGASKLDHQKIIYGKIKDDDKIVDEVLVSYFKSPNSFTGEDICEINCHGGRRVTLDILELVLSNGARIAEPGEFSKRAFLNGKMDLSKAEGIIDLINAKTKLQTRIATEQLEGELYTAINKEREKLIEMLAQIEVSIDYPEYDYEELENDEIKNKLTDIADMLKAYINSYENGKYIKEGINVAILGGTNAGKSSLLNTLAKSEKAIVTDIEGTTRDIVEETIILDNIVLNIFDTAGIRETDDVVEKIGIKRSIEIIDKVDFVIMVIDATKGITQNDIDILEKINQKNKKYIVCLNKVDVSREKIKEIEKNIQSSENVIETSFLTKEGIDTLKEKIGYIFNLGQIETNEEIVIVNQRHKELLEKSYDSIMNAIDEVNKNLGVDIAEINIKNAARYLGEILGQEVTNDIINKIFEKFCLGK